MNSRFIGFVGVLILASLAGAQDLTRKISFSAPAGRASVLFPRLSKELGFDLKTVAQTENEVLLIQVHDVPTRDLMDRIAATANAAWKKEGSSYRLIRPQSLITRQERKEADERSKVFHKFMSFEDAEAQKAPAWSPAHADELAQSLKSLVDSEDLQQNDRRAYQEKARSIERQTPAVSAVHALLDQIGADELAALDPQRRVVYALHPNSVQLRMGGDSASIFSQFAQNQAEYADAYSKLSPQPRSGPRRSSAGDIPAKTPGNPALGIGQAILVLSQTAARVNGPGVAMRATIVVADTAGKTLASGSTVVSDGWGELDYPDLPAQTHPIKLAPSAMEAAKAFGNPYMGFAMDEMPTMLMHLNGLPDPVSFNTRIGRESPRAPLSEELKAVLLHPEKVEPLSLVVGEALGASAKALNLNLVADLPDSCAEEINRLFVNPNETVSAEELLMRECPHSGLQVQRSNGWLTVSAANWSDSQNNRINRVALGKLIRVLDTQKAARLDDLAAFALSQEKAASSIDIDGLYLQVACNSVGRKALATLRAPDCLRIYGTMTPTEKAAMQSNGAVPLEQLSADQKRWLEDDVFNSFDGPVPDDESSSSVPPGFGGQRRISEPFGIQPALQTERTQMLPNGLNGNGRLQFHVTSDSGFNGLDDESGISNFVTCADIAARMFQKEKPALGSPVYYNLFQPATRSAISFQFILSPTASLTRKLENTSVNLSSQAVAFEGLPDDDKKKVLGILDQIRNSPIAKMSVGRAGISRTAPPP